MTTKIYSLVILFIVNAFCLSAQSVKTPVQQFAEHKQLQHAALSFCVKDFTGKRYPHSILSSHKLQHR